MTQKTHQVRLRLGLNTWITIIILALALGGSTVKPLRSTSTVRRGLPAYCLLSFGFMLEAGATVEKSNTVQLSVF
jgi:hypothetical protein